MGYPARAWKAFKLRQARPFQQFGQSDDAYSANGAVGCAFTVLQFLILLWTGKWTTHNQIARIAQFPNMSLVRASRRRGLNVTEIKRVITYYRLPYKVVFGLTADQVLIHSRNGPVAYGMAYSWAPEWKGYVYGGRRADGLPNGFARLHGKTQLFGFTGAHLNVLLGDGTISSGARVIVRFDPNHGSPSRPERPDYDMMSYSQFRAEYNSYSRALGRTAYAIVPTKTLPV